MSAATFRLAMSKGIKGAMLNHELNLISNQVVESQKQKQRDIHNERVCAAMNAHPRDCEKAIGTIIQQTVQTEINNHFRKQQGNINAAGSRNSAPAARPDGFTSSGKDKDQQQGVKRKKLLTQGKRQRKEKKQRD